MSAINSFHSARGFVHREGGRAMILYFLLCTQTLRPFALLSSSTSLSWHLEDPYCLYLTTLSLSPPPLNPTCFPPSEVFRVNTHSQALPPGPLHSPRITLAESNSSSAGQFLGLQSAGYFAKITMIIFFPEETHSECAIKATLFYLGKSWPQEPPGKSVELRVTER